MRKRRVVAGAVTPKWTWQNFRGRSLVYVVDEDGKIVFTWNPLSIGDEQSKYFAKKYGQTRRDDARIATRLKKRREAKREKREQQKENKETNLDVAVNESESESEESTNPLRMPQEAVNELQSLNKKRTGNVCKL